MTPTEQKALTALVEWIRFARMPKPEVEWSLVDEKMGILYRAAIDLQDERDS